MFVRPLAPGRVLTLRDTVLECRASNSRPELGIVRALGELINQDGEVASGESATSEEG
jgi:acyl dehydratase